MRRTLLLFVVAFCVPIAANAQGPKDPNVAIETRFVSVSEGFFERVGIDFDFHYVDPTTGVLGRHFDNGWGGRIGGTINLLDAVGGNRNWKIDTRFGYNYTHYRGNEDFQLNGPATNLSVRSADSHTGDVGLGVRRVINNLELGTCVYYNLGAIQANTRQVAFNHATPTVSLKENPDTDGFTQGYRVRFHADWRVSDRVKVGGSYDVGHDFTGILENDRRGSVNHRFAVHLMFLLGRLDRDQPRREAPLLFLTPRLIGR